MFGNPDILDTKQVNAHQPFKTDNQLDLPLVAPSSQTILPVICGGNGNILGWLSIAKTVFDGTERSYTTSDGPIPITTVTLPSLVQNDDAKRRVQQYMAAVFDDDQMHARPWTAYSAFVGNNESAYSMIWYQPTVGSGYRFNRGPLFTDLTVRMDADDGGAPLPIDPPTGAAATLRWAVALGINDLEVGCGFFDFNWVTLFNAQTTSIDPLRIEIVSNPATGEFKTTVVPYPVVAPLGGPEFNTLRIIKLQDVDAGAYTFTYKIVDTAGGSTTVVLTLNVA